MAWFTYECTDHGKFKASFPKREKSARCPKCSKESRVIMQVGTTRIVERLDNGAMARSVERLHNIEEIMNERADAHTKEDPREEPEDAG